jgi:hypothetical protein
MPKGQPKHGRLWLNDGSRARLRPTHRNHVCPYDFISDRSYDGHAIQMLTVIDGFSYQCLAISADRHITGNDVIYCMEYTRISVRTMNRNLQPGYDMTGSRPLALKPLSLSRVAHGKMDIIKASMASLETNC